MQLICDGLDLSEAVLTVLKATSNRTPNQILEGIKFKAENDTLTLSATDLELSIIKTIKADVKIEGETIVPGAFFSSYLKKLTNEQIELSLNENEQLRIAYTDSEGFVQCYKTDEFPILKKLENAEYFSIKQNDFKELISKVIFAVATDDSRPILKGCLLELEQGKVSAVALDGYRLAYVSKPISESNVSTAPIVPSRSLKEISNLLNDSDEEVKVFVQKNNLMIEVDNTFIISRLLEGEFVKYRHIIPKDFTTVATINKEQIENTLERAQLLARADRNNLVKFDLKEKNMLISSNSDIGNIKENITISLEGADLLIAFNARYVMDALKVIDDEFIKVNFNSAISPCVIQPNEGEDYFYLILPVRLIG